MDTGSQLALDILDAIAHVSGRQVTVTLVLPRKHQEPIVAARSVGQGNVEVCLLHTGAHFTLIKPKKK